MRPRKRESALSAALSDALGHRQHADSTQPRTGGPAGNARLTAWLGLLTLGVILAELVTLLDVTGLIGWHVGIGVVLTALALMKAASTGWRIVRYYVGSAPYLEAGPPPLLLRLLGPLVVVSTFGVLGTGLALIAIGRNATEQTWFSFVGQPVSPLTLHQAFFVLFGGFAGLHVLARIVPAAVLVSGRANRGGTRSTVPGRAARFGMVSAGMIAALVAVTLIVPTLSDWNHHVFDRDDLHQISTH